MRDTTTSDTAVQPTTPLRSGGPGSLVGWDTLGYQGRNFVGRARPRPRSPRSPARPRPTPIRAYAGIASAGECRGAGPIGRRRPASAPAVSTGRTCWSPGPPGPVGWTRPRSTRFEYETGGDSAAVAIQYSYLPSWASFLVDQDQGPGGRPRAVRRGLPEVVRATGRAATQVVRVRVEPGLVRGGDRRSAGRRTWPTAPTASCWPARRPSTR